MAASPDAQDIIIVEDNDDDFEATERALKRNKNLSNPIIRCKDGLDAWHYLTGQGTYATRLRMGEPGLILLDLNMPGLDGRKLLAWMKADEELKKIPVVVMTTSTAKEDIESCYRAGANTYVRKPVSWPEFSEAVTRLLEYWFQIAILPKS